MMAQLKLTQEVFHPLRYSQLAGAGTLVQSLLIAVVISPGCGMILDALKGWHYAFSLPAVGEVVLGPYRLVNLMLGALYGLAWFGLQRVQAATKLRSAARTTTLPRFDAHETLRAGPAPLAFRSPPCSRDPGGSRNGHCGGSAVLPWGDQGDGTYRNPILPADYSDPDVIRVGDDFYLVASEFHFMGIQVLHSRDLVNWRIIGRVFDRLTIDPKYDTMQGYAQGTWAPSLRHHDGLFYLYVCTPREGLLRWTAKDPAGPWQHVTVKQVDQWEDPCPFWDDDGQAYLVHSKLGAGPLILHRLSADGTKLLDDGVEIYRGPVAEGPKLFKRAGWYYISLPEGGVEKGGQSILRSRAIYGPYERRVVTPDGSAASGRYRRTRQRRGVVHRVQIRRSPRPRADAAAGEVGRRWLASVRGRGASGNAEGKKPAGRSRHADQPPADER